VRIVFEEDQHLGSGVDVGRLSDGGGASGGTAPTHG
jgi:hypothetical protein